MPDALLKCFWLEENKKDGHKFHDKGNDREITDTYKFKIMLDFQCITNVGQDRATLVNHLKQLLQMEVLKVRNGYYFNPFFFLRCSTHLIKPLLHSIFLKMHHLSLPHM